jgi:carbamate kinase
MQGGPPVTLAVIALGGNAIAPAGTAGTAEEQTGTIARAMDQVARLLQDPDRALVITHGNGPQVGNLLRKNELARDIVPPMPLDWCVAQTQATIGFTIANTLGRALERHGVDRAVVPLVSRVLVDAGDPAFDAPQKPIGAHVTDEAYVRSAEAQGVAFVETSRGWRRVVPSPTPIASLELATVRAMLEDGAVVVANGGGGVPTVRDPDGALRGVEAVIDKDLAGALLAVELGADRLAILTDVAGVALDFGGPDERWLAEVDVAELRGHAARGAFGAGSMGPKVEAACGFVERTGGTAVIARLEDALDAIEGRAGTRVVPSRPVPS